MGGERPGCRGRRASSSGIPGADQPQSHNRGLDASWSLEGPGRTADPDKVPNTRRLGPIRAPDPAQTFTAPTPGLRGPGPRTATGSSGRTRNSRTAARSAPSRPAQRSRSERKKERQWWRAAPLTMIAAAATPRPRRVVDALSRVAGVPLPRAPACPPYLPPPLPTFSARAARPRLPAPSGSRHSCAGSFWAVSGARSSPPPPRAGTSPSASLGRPKGRDKVGEAAAPRAPALAPSPAGGFPRAAATPPVGQAVICRPSGRPLHGKTQRSPTLGKNPPTRHLPLSLPSSPPTPQHTTSRG